MHWQTRPYGSLGRVIIQLPYCVSLVFPSFSPPHTWGGPLLRVQKTSWSDLGSRQYYHQLE